MSSDMLYSSRAEAKWTFAVGSIVSSGTIGKQTSSSADFLQKWQVKIIAIRFAIDSGGASVWPLEQPIRRIPNSIARKTLQCVLFGSASTRVIIILHPAHGCAALHISIPWK
eukprot:scaffold261450_cov18-Prasinocladus_malaysianus.AAC.1